jgi:hypothetical protein
MKTLVCLLILMGSMCAQEKRSEPYRMNDDVLGESLEEFQHNNPKCVVQDPLEGMLKGPGLRQLGCIPEINGETPTEPNTNWEPDTNYYGIPLWTRKATFTGENGLVGLSFAFRSADAGRLEEHFTRDVGPPSTHFPIWENGTSAIILQAKVGNSKYGLLILMQNKFAWQIAELAKAMVQQRDATKAKVQQNAPPVSNDPAQK